MVINSINNERIKNISKLKMKKYRNIENKFIVEGEHLVNEAYNKGYLIELIKLESYDFEIDVPVIEVSCDVIKKISTLETPPNILGICKFKEESDNIGNKILILDNIQDPGNLGTIIRSSVAFNIDTLVVSDNTVDIYNDKVIRASQGMIFDLFIKELNIIDFIKELKNKGYYIYGTDVIDGTELKNIEKCDKYAIIVGNEGTGISSTVKDLCDKNIYINMEPNCESLNVGIATSIILYKFYE